MNDSQRPCIPGEEKTNYPTGRLCNLEDDDDQGQDQLDMAKAFLVLDNHMSQNLGGEPGNLPCQQAPQEA